MDQRHKILDRVRASTSEIVRLVDAPSNVPLENYIDQVSIIALSDSLGLGPEDWENEDLERVLIIRDGLYDIRQKLRDAGDEAEHSVEQLLFALDRLYADLDRALRELNTEEVILSQQKVSDLRAGRKIDASQIAAVVESIHQQSTEVLTQSHVTNRNIEFNLIKIDNSSLELFRSVNLKIKRFSASVFAIRLSLEQKVIFEGIFSFLNERADSIVQDLKKFVSCVKPMYATTIDLLEDVSKLAEIGGRFTKQVSSFINRIFGGQSTFSEENIKFKIQSVSQSEVVLCGAKTSKNVITLGGKQGLTLLVDTSASRIVNQRKITGATIQSLVRVSDDLIALGTDEGLDLVSNLGRDHTHFQGSYNEKVTAVVSPAWGQRGVGIVTGSRDGYLRRWSLAGGLTRYRGGDGRDIDIKVGRSIQRLLEADNQIIVASGEELLLVDEFFQQKSPPINSGFHINDMCLFDGSAVIICGKGRIAHVNFESGAYTRMIGETGSVNYTAVCKLNDHVYCVGADDGKIRAVEFESGEELGYIDVGWEIRGLIATTNRLLAFGGAWNSPRGRTVAFVTRRRQPRRCTRPPGSGLMSPGPAPNSAPSTKPTEFLLLLENLLGLFGVELPKRGIVYVSATRMDRLVKFRR